MEFLDKLPDLINNFGFPMILTFYLLMRTETKIEKLTEVISGLTKVIQKCTK